MDKNLLSQLLERYNVTQINKENEHNLLYIKTIINKVKELIIDNHKKNNIIRFCDCLENGIEYTYNPNYRDGFHICTRDGVRDKDEEYLDISGNFIGLTFPTKSISNVPVLSANSVMYASSSTNVTHSNDNIHISLSIFENKKHDIFYVIIREEKSNNYRNQSTFLIDIKSEQYKNKISELVSDLYDSILGRISNYEDIKMSDEIEELLGIKLDRNVKTLNDII